MDDQTSSGGATLDDQDGAAGGGTGAGSAEELDALKRANALKGQDLAKWKDKARKLELDIEQLRQQFAEFDPDEYKALKQDKAERERQDAEKKQDWAKEKTKILEQHQVEQAEWKRKWEKQSVEQQQTLNILRQNVLQNAVVNMAAQLEAFNPLQIYHLLTAEGRVRLEDDTKTITFLDATGEPEVNSGGDRLSLKEGIVRYLDENPNLVKSNLAAGSGYRPGSRSARKHEDLVSELRQLTRSLEQGLVDKKTFLERKAALTEEARRIGVTKDVEVPTG